MRTLRFGIEWLIALTITAGAVFLFINGSLFSTWNALHIDLSINLVAADALRDGVNPYGPSTLMERATELGSPTILIYNQLFTSYIQPPTSALALLPFTELSWRDATRTYVVLSHFFLAGAVIVTLITVQPTLPVRWVIAGACLLLALFSQIYMSFALGQVDATITFLLAIAFWAYTRDKPAIAGGAIALGAAIKLIPALLLLYFLWRREYRLVAWGAGVGALLFLASWAYAGTDVYRTYLTETVPALLKGSTHYSNASIGALLARFNTPDFMGGLPEMLYLDEVPSGTGTRLISLAVGIGALILIAAVTGWRRSTTREEKVCSIFAFNLVVAVGLVISSVMWEFYAIWLIPAFVAAFLAPNTVLPVHPALRAVALLAFVVALIGINYPGDFYLFDRNDFFYHPEWVPGIWVEDRVLLYHKHLDAVLYLRLPSLLFFIATLSALILGRRLAERRHQPAPEAAPAALLAETPEAS